MLDNTEIILVSVLVPIGVITLGITVFVYLRGRSNRRRENERNEQQAIRNERQAQNVYWIRTPGKNKKAKKNGAKYSTSNNMNSSSGGDVEWNAGINGIWDTGNWDSGGGGCDSGGGGGDSGGGGCDSGGGGCDSGGGSSYD